MRRRHRGRRPSFRVRGTDYPRRNLSQVPAGRFKVERRRMDSAHVRDDTEDTRVRVIAAFPGDFFSPSSAAALSLSENEKKIHVTDASRQTAIGRSRITRCYLRHRHQYKRRLTSTSRLVSRPCVCIDVSTLNIALDHQTTLCPNDTEV